MEVRDKGEVGTRRVEQLSFLLRHQSGQTDRQTDRRSQHLATATGAENSASTVVGQHVVTAAVVACTS